MQLLDRLIGRVSPQAALRRATRLSEDGRSAQALPLLRRAAQAGIGEAQYRIALAYLQGSGVPASTAEAVRWLERAAKDGFVEAQTALAALLLHGIGNSASTDEAVAGSRLFAAERRGEPDFASALSWAKQAAEAGSAKAQALIGYILTGGPEALRDAEAARQWYQRSAASGCPEGCLGYAIALAPNAEDEDGKREVTALLRQAAEA